MTYKIKQGDCLELMRQIPSGSIDMILCDLPYGTTACKWDISRYRRCYGPAVGGE